MGNVTMGDVTGRGVMGTVDLATLGPGFAQPVRDSQAAFRGVLHALSGPGVLVTLAHARTAGGFGAAGAIALTLLDFETPVWLGAQPGAAPDSAPDAAFAGWLRFHCGAPLTTDPAKAAFAFVRAESLPDLAVFHVGTEKYPDSATTLVITVPALEGGPAVALEGPGIKSRRTIAPQGLPAGFWAQAAENRAQFQLGVDIILTAGEAIIGLPRSTRILQEA